MRKPPVSQVLDILNIVGYISSDLGLDLTKQSQLRAAVVDSLECLKVVSMYEVEIFISLNQYVLYITWIFNQHL